MTFLVGKVVEDVNAGAPNNGEGEDNVGKVKSLKVGRDTHPYVSAQAFRRWLRDSMPPEEKRSEVTRTGTGKNQQAYTAGRPDLYLDDDLFGYMVAIKKENFQRDTVLATGTLVSVVPQRITTEFGTMSRGFKAGEHPVIHQHQLYSAVLAGDLLLDLPRVGVFETDGSGLRVALPKAAAEAAVEAGAEPVTFRNNASVRLPLEERRRRVAVLLRALATLRGGAKQSLHYGDRTPALVLLAPMKGGVNPFTRVIVNREQAPFFNADVLRDEMKAWGDELDGPVSIGWAPGFLGDQRDRVKRELKDLIEAGKLTVDHPRTVLTTLAKRFTDGELDGWFEDQPA
ncbi:MULTISPECIES: type I-B CRISPR-associated protein Cas7/Cst2/DevR [unclassified Streptomyces]|uniref:type I-B CRISPR-associated protein Cas7/Cst2/DevR n=1 Tax=unclassified Streptomyces TaxID=2593676 RepID=UPI000CD4D54D|nr:MULTISPECIES: type I-B CRISPR-associated protein Cas7/Cst2/DevR [unclassified Streptomyces]